MLRDGQAGVETLFLLRPVEAEFVPRAQVFPGGRIDEADAEDPWSELVDMSVAEAAAALGSEVVARAPARSFFIGAIREVFEETGVLLALAHGQSPDARWLASARSEVHGGRASFAEVLRQASLAVRPRELVPFARWVTPEALPKRYDTFFFAAAMPPGQEAVAAPGEIASLEWVTPAAALARADSRDAYTLPPTRAALTALSKFDSVAAALAGLAQAAELSPILPRVRTAPEGRSHAGIQVVMPGEPGYTDPV
ncbi:MAG: NUDIX hydrolase [Candidatus Dormibacteria bacterium]